LIMKTIVYIDSCGETEAGGSAQRGDSADGDGHGPPQLGAREDGVCDQGRNGCKGPTNQGNKARLISRRPYYREVF
jgi:hypothetical protein